MQSPPPPRLLFCSQNWPIKAPGSVTSCESVETCASDSFADQSRWSLIASKAREEAVKHQKSNRGIKNKTDVLSECYKSPTQGGTTTKLKNKILLLNSSDCGNTANVVFLQFLHWVLWSFSFPLLFEVDSWACIICFSSLCLDSRWSISLRQQWHV